MSGGGVGVQVLTRRGKLKVFRHNIIFIKLCVIVDFFWKISQFSARHDAIILTTLLHQTTVVSTSEHLISSPEEIQRKPELFRSIVKCGTFAATL